MGRKINRFRGSAWDSAGSRTRENPNAAWPQTNSSYRSETLRCRSETMRERRAEVTLSDSHNVPLFAAIPTEVSGTPLFGFCPGISERHDSIKDGLFRSTVRVDEEIALPLKLAAVANIRSFQRFFKLRGHNRE